MQIKWENRFSGAFNHCNVSVDGTDFKICEPSPFQTKWYSHKFNGPGLRYEVGICIGTGHIVWVHGPFPCGRYSDLSIFRLGMKESLLSGEKVVADGGYRDNCCEQLGGQSSTLSKVYSVVRARHETVNRRLKQFFVLGHRFRHDLSRHSACFHAVSNLTQLMIENGEPLFSVE